MIKIELKNLLSLIVLLQFITTGPAQAQLDLDPVVISFGDTQISRRQFEQEFEIAMVMKALETGVPIKNQAQISLMEHRFLEQRAREMVFLQIAEKQGIEVTEQELVQAINEYLYNLGINEVTEKNVRRVGFEDERQFREILRQQRVISKFIANIRNGLETGQNPSTINDILDEYYAQSGIRTYPERIDRPYLN